MDGATGRIVQGLIPPNAIVGEPRSSSLFLYDMRAEHTISIAQSDGLFTLMDSELSRIGGGLWRVIPCLRDLSESQRTFILNKIVENRGHLDSPIVCRKVGNIVLTKNIVTGSSGEWHVDLLFNLSAESLFQNIGNTFSLVNPTRVNFTWVGVSQSRYGRLELFGRCNC